MIRMTVVAAILAACAAGAQAADALVGQLPKGTICYAANGMRFADSTNPITCKGIDRKFTSISEIYERGYRVVSSGVIPEPGSTVYIIIELRQ